MNSINLLWVYGRGDHCRARLSHGLGSTEVEERRPARIDPTRNAKIIPFPKRKKRRRRKT